MRKLLVFMIVMSLACLTAACSDKPEETEAQVPASAVVGQTPDTEKQEKQGLDLFVGEWVCEAIKTKYGFETDVTLNIFNENGTPRVLCSSDTFGVYFAPAASVFDDRLTVSINDEENRATLVLGYVDAAKRLRGTYSQYGETADTQFRRVSPTPTDKEFYQKYPEFSVNERKRQLLDFSSYSDDGISIPFSYTLNQREPWENIIREHALDALTKGKTDVELMKTLLFWVSDNFKHGNPKENPSLKREAVSIIEACGATGGYANCRGLSLILADLCRAYGIPAKHITCMPKEKDFRDCHVVVVAYSDYLQQWIMLDPTYKLILRDENDNYMSLQALRESLINDRATIPNEEFSYNGGEASVESYRDYMTKNTFRFTSATDFYYGAEEGFVENFQNMLIPSNYSEDRSQITTTSEKAFWAAP